MELTRLRVIGKLIVFAASLILFAPDSRAEKNVIDFSEDIVAEIVGTTESKLPVEKIKQFVNFDSRYFAWLEGRLNPETITLLVKIVLNRIEYGYASPLEVFDYLLSSPPARPGEIANGWLQFMTRIVNKRLDNYIDDSDLKEGIHKRLVLMDNILLKLASSGREERHIRLLTNLAGFRATAGWDSALPLLEEITKNNFSGSDEVRIALTEAYLRLNLVFDAQRVAKGIELDSQKNENVFKALSFAKELVSFQINCFSGLESENLKNDIDTALAYLLATNGIQDGFKSYSHESESEGKVQLNVEPDCKNYEGAQIFQKWSPIFDKDAVAEQTLHTKKIPSEMKRQQLNKISFEAKDISMLRTILEGVGEVHNKKEQISGVINKASVFKLLKKAYLEHELNEQIKYHSMVPSDAEREFGAGIEPPPKLNSKKFNVDFFEKMEDVWIVRVVGVDESLEFFMIIDRSDDVSLLTITTTETSYQFTDVTGDGHLDLLIEAHDTMDSRLLVFYVVDLIEKAGYSIGEQGGFYHGLIRVSSLNGSLPPSIVVGMMQDERMIDDCNTCPGRYVYAVYHFNENSKSMLLTGLYQSTAQIADSQSEGLMGLSSGGILSSNFSEIESKLEQFEVTNFDVGQRIESESLLRENLETALYYVKSGNVSAGDNLARRVFAKLNSMRELPWATELLAIAHWVWADGLRSAGESERAKQEIENLDLLQAVSTGKIPKIDIMILDALISYDLGDLSRAYINNELIINAPDDRLSKLGEYVQFLLSIGYVEQANALNDRILNNFSFPEFLLNKAVLTKGDTLNKIRLLTISINKARLFGDRGVVASVFLESGKLSYLNKNYKMAESFFVAAMFESSSAWWKKSGPELMVHLGQAVAQRNVTLARDILVAAAKIGDSYNNYRARSEALYEASKLTDGDERFSFLMLAYEAATRFRSRIPTEERKLDYVKSTDSMVEDLLINALTRSVSEDEVLGIIERWRFQVFNELYTPVALTQQPVSNENLGKKIRSEIASSDALVVYYVGKMMGLAVVANKDYIQISKLNLNIESAKALAIKTMSNFDLGSASARQAIEADRIPVKLKNLLAEGFEELIAPLNLKENTKRIVIIPDKSMNGISWAALDTSRRYFYSKFLESLGYVRISPLAERFEINILPSTLVMTKNEGASLSAALIASGWGLDGDSMPNWFSASDRLAVGKSGLHPLNGTLDEVNKAESFLKVVYPPPKISKLLFSPTLPFSDELDEMKIISDAVSGKSILLIAAHGIYNSNLPMSSFLLIDSSSHGLVLRASDFFKFDLSKAKVVILTACQSANVDIRAGNEAMGFTRALFASGAQALVLTGWLVDDTVSVFYTSKLFNELSKGLDIRSAHVNAINLLRERYTHPFYWGGYMLFSRD
ncbi:CHAT domain-containing protein [Pseudomonas sp. LB3P25]